MTAPVRPEVASLGRVRVAMTFELVADEIRRAVTLGRYAAGDRLPSERELSQQLGVARATLREATRMLVSEGLLEVRRGAHGGIRVAQRVRLDKLTLRRELRRIAGEVDDILDLRIALESGAAHFAATRRTTEDLVALQDAFDRMQCIFDEHRLDAVGEFWRADVDFHTVLASAGHNQLLTSAVENARMDFLRPIGHVFSAIQPNAHDGHREILDAVRDHDREAAAIAARDHIEVTRRAFYEVIDLAPGRRHGR